MVAQQSAHPGPNPIALALQRAQARIHEQDAEMATLRQRIREQDETITYLQSELARRREADAIVRNVNRSNATASEKRLVPYLFQQLERPDLDHKDGHVYMNHQTAAKALGMNENTVGLAMSTWVATGAVTKLTEPRQNAEGQWYDAPFYKPVPEVLRVIHDRPKEELKQVRSQRYRCRKCGSDEHITLVTRTELHCICGHTEVLKQQVHKQPPADVSEQEIPTDLQNVEPETGGTDPENLDVLKQESHTNITSENEADGSGLENVDPEEAAIPVLVDIPTSWDDARLEQEAGALLQWVGKDCSVVVEMSQRPDMKYFEPTLDGKRGGPKEPLTLEAIQSHLAGRRCLAYKQVKEARYHRMVIKDFDTAAGVRAVEVALPLLVEAGLLPVLEYSPVHGAGLVKDNGEPRDSAHLLLAFRQVVDARGVDLLLDQVAPELRQHVDKAWPHGANMRMPGGYYKRPEVEGWCLLKSGVTGEQARHGPDAWRILLSHLADPTIVPDVPPDPPAPEPPPRPKFTPSAPSAGLGGAWIPDLQWHEVPDAFNARFTLDDIHPRETATHARADWRKEQVPSVQYNESGIAWDYGEQRALDAFELEVLVNWHGDKRACWRHWKKQLTGDILARRGAVFEFPVSPHAKGA